MAGSSASNHDVVPRCRYHSVHIPFDIIHLARERRPLEAYLVEASEQAKEGAETSPTNTHPLIPIPREPPEEEVHESEETSCDNNKDPDQLARNTPLAMAMAH